MKDLTERKQKILKAVVDEYIENASPVSSGEIKTKHFENISSATIRNELSALEEMGYLIQPHTSAGRVPSKKAYGLYVDKFLVDHPLSTKEIQIIEDSFKERFDEVQDIVKRTAKVISDITNYTSVIVLKNINFVLLKEIKLVGLDDHSALLIVITDSGIIRDKVISLADKVNDKYISEANKLLNSIFAGKKVGEIATPDNLIQKQFEKYKELYDSVLKVLKKYSQNTDRNVFLDGQAKFLEYPDQDINSTKDFLAAIDTKERIADIIDNNNDIEFSVKIGKDETGGIENCAVVTAKYKLQGKEIGHAGVIGPERMDYSKVMSVLNYIGKTLDEIVDGGNDDQERLRSKGKERNSGRRSDKDSK
jgi:heat-inducible transcriptional repressor